MKRQSIIWLLVNSVAVSLLLIFVSIAVLLEPNWIDINSYLGSRLNVSFNYVLGIIGVMLIPLAYLVWRILRLVRPAMRSEPVKQSLVNRILPIVFSSAYLAVLVLLVVLWGEDGILVVRAVEYMSPALFLGLNCALLIGLYFLLREIIVLYQKMKQNTLRHGLKEAAVLGVVLLFCGLVFAAPFVLVPSNVVAGTLPDKPLVIAHRNGSSLGPENTLETAQTALAFGISGIEIDVQVSLDGVPFLMHDETLKRTTNVEELFPGNESKPASLFIISNLRQLDAGSWFTDDDPYGTIASGTVSAEQAEGYRGAMIPTLAEVLDFVEANGLLLDVDFKPPRTSHPFYSDYFNICLSTLRAADIDDQIWIATGNTEWLDATEALAPGMITAIGVGIDDAPSVDQFEASGYEMVNTHNGLPNQLLRSYEDGGVTVNAWTVNTVFRYSQLWCLGVDYVTTDYPQSFALMVHPAWSLPLLSYEAVWLIEYTVGLSVLVLLTRRKAGSISV